MSGGGLKDMEAFVPLLSTTDTKQKISVGQELLTYLQAGSPIECSDIGLAIDSLIPWIQNSNFKVSQMGLDVMTELAARMGVYFKPYIPSILPVVIDRLGDSKELVRERCQLLLQRLLEGGTLTPQQLFERLNSAFTHKNSNVREEVLRCLTATLNQHGAGCLSISKLMPSIVKLLSDPTAQVRDAATNSLTDIYRHVGDRLRNDLVKKHQVPTTKLPALLAKFDEIKAAGDLLPTALTSNNNFDEDETDRIAPSSIKRLNSALPKKAPLSAAKSLPQTPITPCVSNSTSKLVRLGSLRKTNSSGQAGAVDEEGFLKAFEDTPSVQIFSPRDLEENLNNVQQIISNPANDWNKRVDALKKVRSLIYAGALNYEEFYNHLRLLDPPFQISLKDLRSQVVREACFTVAFMSQQIGNKLEHMVESLIPLLFNLIQNSAKVIASCGQVCIGFIVQHVQSVRLVPLLCSPLAHKSRDIRRAAARFIHQILSHWSHNTLLRHASLLQSSLQQAIPDADQEVRLVSRKSFWAFKNHFPEQAEVLMNSLDATCKRSLQSDLSNSSSSNSLNQIHSSVTTPRPRLVDCTPVRRPPVSSITTPRTASPRSNSAIDLQAAQRAKARAQYAAMARQKIGSNASLPRLRKTPGESGPSSLVSTIVSPERIGRQRTRTTKPVSQSQPSSRSGSPSSRLNYATYGFGDRSKRSPSYSSRSTAGSRETSPCRFSPQPPLSKLKSRGSVERSCLPTRPPVMTQKFLQQSIEAESALADALGYENSSFSPTRRLRDEHSDDSETSSACSERSFESYRRTSDSYSWSGSQSRLYRDVWDTSLKDINDILMACESTHWSDRKDGLVSLSNYLQGGSSLTPQQLTRVTDNFTKMLSDSHTKVFSLFLDTVNDLIIAHASDLHHWLYILLTRLFNKLGGDLLGSIHTKIQKTLHVIREHFGCEAMLHWALRFLVDSTQTPNIKVKLSVLQFVAKMAPLADPSQAFPPPTPGRDKSKDVTTSALNKMIGWTMGDSIKQGSELRRAAQEAILALFNLNTPQVTMRFSHLPKEYQEAAASLIQGRVRRASSSGSGDSPSRSHHDSLSPDQVYRSLRRTTAEIQNYSYGETGVGTRVIDTTSHDSGISQMSSADKGDIDLVTAWTSSLSLGSPTKHNGTAPTSANSDHTDSGNQPSDNGISANDMELGGVELGEVGEASLVRLMEAVENRKHRPALSQLVTFIKEADPDLLNTHFKRLLRILVSEVTSDEVENRVVGLKALGEMMKKKSLHEKFQSFAELIILRVIQAYGDSNKDVTKQAEFCAASLATILQSTQVLKVLSPLICTEDFPLNLAAIKTITKMVEVKTKEELLPYLEDIMPGLIQAYGNDESLVRKAAVFCMVALHNCVGADALKPFLSRLNASKLKLLQLYISRAPTQQNGTKSDLAGPT